MKHAPLLLHAVKPLRFISHMVQMKHQLVKVYIALFYPLYPTWFRWNVDVAYEIFDAMKLYIPHGSDET